MDLNILYNENIIKRFEDIITSEKSNSYNTRTLNASEFNNNNVHFDIDVDLCRKYYIGKIMENIKLDSLPSSEINELNNIQHIITIYIYNLIILGSDAKVNITGDWNDCVSNCQSLLSF